MSKFNWKKYIKYIDIENLPKLKQREYILARERYLFNEARKKIETERKLVQTLREQLNALESGYQKIIPKIMEVQAGGMIHTLAKQFLPLAKYQIRNEEGFLVGLANTEQQLKNVLSKLHVPKSEINIEQELEKRPEVEYRGVKRKILTLPSIEDIGNLTIYKVSHTKRKPLFTHLDTSVALTRINRILTNPETSRAYKTAKENLIKASTYTIPGTLPSTPIREEYESSKQEIIEEQPPSPKGHKQQEPQTKKEYKYQQYPIITHLTNIDINDDNIPFPTKHELHDIFKKSEELPLDREEFNKITGKRLQSETKIIDARRFGDIIYYIAEHGRIYAMYASYTDEGTKKITNTSQKKEQDKTIIIN